MIPPPPAVAAPAEADLDAVARPLAVLAPVERDRLIAAEVAVAIREHRIADAIRWQRIRLRARRLHDRGAAEA